MYTVLDCVSVRALSTPLFDLRARPPAAHTCRFRGTPFLPVSSMILSLHLSFSSSVPRHNSDPGSLRTETGSSSPSPLRYAPSFYREKTPAFSSLVDSYRIAPAHAARRSQQLIRLISHDHSKPLAPESCKFRISATVPPPPTDSTDPLQSTGEWVGKITVSLAPPCTVGLKAWKRFA